MTTPLPSVQPNETSRVWRAALLWSLFGLCCLTRLLDLGYKAIMHDEALFVYYTWAQLYDGWTYFYLPILHGPAMLHLQALVFHLFGATDYTMRLGCALLGIAGFWWVWMLRPWLKPAGTCFALTLYTVSPGLTYYQRFFRNDALFLFNSLWIVTSLAYWWRTRNPRWLASGIVGAAVLFTNKENSLFVYFSIVTFAVLLILHDLAAEFLSESQEPRVPRESVPRVPNAAWGVLVAGAAVVLVVTQVFEGLKYDADVVQAIGHDWVLRDVRTIPAALGWHGVQPDWQWLKFYAALFVGLLVVIVALRFAIANRLGGRQVLPSLWMRLHESRYHLAGGLATAVVIYLLVFTTVFKNPTGFFEVYAKTWSYWGGQHEWGRIGGPFHQHLLNMVVYEMPAVLIVLAAWLGGMFRANWTRTDGIAFLLMLLPVAAFHKLIFSGLDFIPPGMNSAVPLEVDFLKTLFVYGIIATLLVLILPRFGRPVFVLCFAGLILYSVFYFAQPAWDMALNSRLLRGLEPIELARRQVTLRDFMEIQFNFDGASSLVMVLVLVFFATAYTWLALSQGRRFHAFLIWWFVTAAGAASYAREAVPQVGIHAMLPLVLLAGSYFGQWFHGRPFGVGRGLLIAGAALLALWNMKATFNLNFEYPDDPRERMVYGPAPQDIRNHCKFVEEYVKIAPLRIGADKVPAWITQHNELPMHKDVRVGVQSDQTVWAVRWYLRDVDWREEKNIEKLLADDYHFIFVEVPRADSNAAFAEKYHLFRGSGIRFWLPVPLQRERLQGIWQAWIPGHYLDGSRNAQPAQDAQREWRKLIRYLTRRETFNGGVEGSGSISGTDYYFGVRKDLY